MIEALPFLIGMAVLLALSSFFSGSETALFSLSPSQVHQFATSRHRIGHMVATLVRDPESLLISLLIGNMAVNVVYFTFASVSMLILRRNGFGGGTLTLLSLGALVVLVLVGEVGPKVLAFSHPRASARLIAVPMFLMHRGLGPLRRLLHAGLIRPLTRLLRPADPFSPQVTVEELRALLEISEHRGILGADETMMLQEIVGLAEAKVREVMVPRTRMIAFDVAGSRKELLALFARTHLGKVPVYRDDLDDIIGLAYAKRVHLEPDAPLEKLLTPVRYVAELSTVEQLLLDFRRSRTQIAIVVDEYGGTAGLITVEDVVEEIVGDLDDAQSPLAQPLVQQVGSADYLVGGDLSIRDWAEAFGQGANEERLATVGGLVLKLMGRLPRPGDTVDYGNMTFRVESMNGRRIGRLHLTLRPARGEDA
ncbi:MAG: hypothetical protein BIFFINMI_01906 [Phycisphaerae bacterium]|nr:hypothetical protein [Phycisphaerae bacterium]